MQVFEIFKTGEYTAKSGETIAFSADDLRASADAYDPSLHEAPIVVGHPDSDHPAYGWVKGLAFGDDALSVTPGEVDAGFAELVKAGRFKKVSASFYKPDAPANPKPGAYYLRHVGFLGAQPPAVKGLKPVSFDDGGDGIVEFGDFSDRTVASLFRSLREWIIEKFGTEDADKALSGFQVDMVQEEAAQPDAKAQPAFSEPAPPRADKPDPSIDKPPSTKDRELSMGEPKDNDLRTRETEIEEKSVAVDSEREALDKDKASFAEDQAKALAAENAAYLETLIETGRFPPGHKDAVLAFMGSIEASEETVSFGEGDDAKSRSPLQVFKDFIGSLPKSVDFGEASKKAAGDLDTTEPTQIAQAAVVYQEEMRGKGVTVSTDVAVRHVLKETS